MWGSGLYSSAMHDFVMRELEVGFRVAAAEDSEACGFGPLLDLQYMEYIRYQNEQIRIALVAQGGQHVG
jgi:hypothetical protein